MAWYYHLDGESRGPVEIAELQQLQQGSVIGPDTLVWTEGMAQWEPYQSSRAMSPATAAQGTVVTRVCSECARRFPEDEMLHYENSWVCAACKPIFFQRIKEGATVHGTLEYATVGKRFVAVFLDGLLLWCVMMIFLGPALYGYFIEAFNAARNHAGHAPPPSFSIGTRLYMYLIEYGFPAAYEIFFIGKYGATLGKMAMKIKVVTPEGSPISYARATGRHFAKILSGIILYIGYLMAFWDEEKRALHDRMCKTRVVDNPS